MPSGRHAWRNKRTQIRRYRKKRGQFKNRKATRAITRYSTRAASLVFPPVGKYTFTYSDDIDLTCTPGGYAYNSFKGNGLYDPDTTGTGHQPRYFDTLLGANGGSAPYHAYSVLGAKIDLFVRNPTSNHMFVAISMCAPQTSVPVTLEEARERPDTVIRVIGPADSGSSTAKMSMFRSTARVLGVKDTLDLEGARAVYNADPATGWTILVTAYNPDSVATETIKVNPRISYYTRLFQLNDVADS